MHKLKVNVSMYFRDASKEELFLFQVINYGVETDELKFSFNHPDAGTGIVYTESETGFSDSDIIKLHAEITYHSDGSVLQKLPKYNERDSTVYKNPFGTGSRRAPLNQIREWTPIVRYWVVDYRICRKAVSSNSLLLPSNIYIFNGDPFGCMLYLGHNSNPTPTTKNPAEIIYRLDNVASDIDLLVQIGKSTYGGRMIQLPNTGIQVWATHNVVEILEVRE
jgi:hypothetical protein